MKETTTLLADVVKALEMLMPDAATDGTLAELTQRLDLCNRISGQIRSLTEALQEDIASRMEEDVASIAGIGIVQRKPRTSSTWIDDTSRERMMDDAISAIIRKVAVDPASGEIHGPLANVAREVWRLTQDSFSFTADPKAAFRKVLGLAPDEYRSKRVTGYTVTITEGEKDVANK